jgi:hypothetical protein
MKIKHRKELSIPDSIISQFSYNAQTGVISHFGKEVGSKHPSGYCFILIDGLLIPAHRLAWRLYYGVWPSCCVDHINGKRNDNSISNLRDVTIHENAANCVIHRAGKLPGSSFYRPTGKYLASVTIAYKLIKIGFYETAQEAHLAYIDYCSKNGLISTH